MTLGHRCTTSKEGTVLLLIGTELETLKQVIMVSAPLLRCVPWSSLEVFLR